MRIKVLLQILIRGHDVCSRLGWLTALTKVPNALPPQGITIKEECRFGRVGKLVSLA